MDTMTWCMPARLRQAREQKGYTVEHVAGVLGVKLEHIWALENQGPHRHDPAEKKISRDEMRKFSHLYDRSEKWLEGIGDELDYVSGPSMEYMPVRLKVARKQMGLTQEHVAGELGVPRAHILALENGTPKKINYLEMRKLAHLYGTNTTWLGGGHTVEYNNDKPDYAKDYVYEINEHYPDWKGNTEGLHKTMKLFVEAHNLKRLVGRDERCVPGTYNVQCAEMIDGMEERNENSQIVEYYKDPEIRKSSSVVPPDFWIYEFPNSTGEAFAQGEYYAQLERRRLGLGHTPIDNIVNLFMDQDVLFSMTELDTNVSGVSLFDTRVGFALVTNSARMKDLNADALDLDGDWLHHTAQRLSAIHHYGRFLFNRTIGIHVNHRSPEGSITKSKAVRRDNERTLGFSGEFLLPKLGLDEELIRIGKGAATRETHFSIDVTTGKRFKAESRHTSHSQEIGVHDIILIAHRFGVSYKMVVLRLASLRYVSEAQMKVLLSKDAKTNANRYSKMIRNSDFGKGCDMPSVAVSRLHGTIATLAIEARRTGKISIPELSEYAKLIGEKPSLLIEIAKYVAGRDSGNRLSGKSKQPV